MENRMTGITGDSNDSHSSLPVTGFSSPSAVATEDVTLEHMLNTTAGMDLMANETSSPVWISLDPMDNETHQMRPLSLQDDYAMTRYTVVVSGFVCPILAIVTILCNILVCVVLLKKNMRTPTNVVLVAMALSDMLTGVWPMPCFIYFYTLGNWAEWLPYRWCGIYDILIEYMPTIFHTASIWLTVALAIQRYIYVCHSFRAKQWCTVPNVIKVVVFIYVAAFLSQVSRFAEFNYKPVPLQSRVHGPNVTIMGCVRHVAPFVESNIQVYFGMYYWTRVLLVHVVPCTTLVVLNSLLVSAMRSAQARRRMLLKQNRKSESRRLKESNCTTLMLVVVVGVFLLVELPMAICLILFIMENTLETGIMEANARNVTTIFINLFILLSYPINFFVYCGMSKQFRETFKRLFTPGAAPLDREHSQYMSLATENGGKLTLPTNETAM